MFAVRAGNTWRTFSFRRPGQACRQKLRLQSTALPAKGIGTGSLVCSKAGPVGLTSGLSPDLLAAASSMRILLLLLAVAAAAGTARARFVIEEGGLKIALPDTAKKQYPGGFDMALANFGAR